MRGLMESNNTVELRHLVNDPNFDIFDFPYDFYDDNLRAVFEELFIQKYYFYEIGCEVPARWKHMLMAHLNEVMPYYRKLYEIELAQKGINFLLNKDLREEFSRTLTEDEKQKENISSTNNSSNNTTGSSSNNFKESSLDNGIADLTDDRITTVNDSMVNSIMATILKDNGLTDRANNKLNNLIEKTVLVSQGNIGVTSSAELVQKWRDIAINLMQMLLESCRDLFMLVF